MIPHEFDIASVENSTIPRAGFGRKRDALKLSRRSHLIANDLGYKDGLFGADNATKCKTKVQCLVVREEPGGEPPYVAW